MKKPYCCDESRAYYERYYDRQQKGQGDFPVYVGRYMQRGHGLGNMLRSLFRRALPFMKAAVPHVLRTGANVVQDVVSGKTWKQAAIKRVPEGLRDVKVNDKTLGVLLTAGDLVERFTDKEQTGSGKRKRKRHNKKDIFD